MGKPQATIKDKRGHPATTTGMVTNERWLHDADKTYRNAVGPVGRLSPGQVRELAQLIQHAQGQRQGGKPGKEVEEAQEAKRRLVEANLRLVLYVAKKYRGLGVDIMDLVQEGNLGLMHAAEKFDHTSRLSFGHYESWSILAVTGCFRTF
jgi:RNA polymerase primary sigma factor